MVIHKFDEGGTHLHIGAAMKKIFLDSETFSATPIRDGTYAYAADAEVMLLAYAYENDPFKVVDLTAGETLPQYLIDDLTDPEYLKVIQNSMFDRTVLRLGLGINIPPEQIFDTMVCALAHSLPGSLKMLCEVLQVNDDDIKDERGKELIQLFCKPRPKNQKVRRFTRETNPKEWQEFKEYAGSDIKAMRAVFNKIPTWNYRGRELELWGLDQRINDRGFRIDRDLAASAIEAVAEAQAGLADDVVIRTFGEVGKATQRDRLLKFILEYYDVDLPDMTKSTLERRLNDPDLPRAVKELLAIRLEASMASTSKYKALLKSVSDDDRLRGTLQFCGASRTGRWSGRTFQPQNLFRPTLKNEVIEEGIEILKSGHANLILPNVMEVAANAVRGCIVASPGKKLIVSDLSNIEGRFAAWVAGEEWKLKAFADFDKGIGHDLYKMAYGKAFGVDPSEAVGPKRQIGKVMELMLGYGGGVGAFITGAASYRIDLDEMAEMALPSIPVDVREESLGFWEWTVKQKRSTFGLERNTFVVCDGLKRLFRRSNSNIAAIWDELQGAFVQAIYNPGVPFQVRKHITIQRDGVWLRIRLPSGRVLCYPTPRIDAKNQITYAGINPYSRKWTRIKTYSGKIFENICQAGSRDVMAHNMPTIDAAGYEILLTVHDELITEAPDTDDFTDEELSALMSTNPPWADGLPLAAGGFTSYRYKKE